MNHWIMILEFWVAFEALPAIKTTGKKLTVFSLKNAKEYKFEQQIPVLSWQ